MPSLRKLSRRDPESLLHPRAAWSASFDAFIGPSVALPVFGIEGRDEEFDHIWDVRLHDAPLWASPDGYRICAVPDPDWTPETLVLVSPLEGACGFYSGGLLWVDAAHRGRGLGAELVLAMTDALEASPTAYHGGLGFSPSGMAAHQGAWRLAVRRAVEQGLPVPGAVREEAALLDAERQQRQMPSGLTPR